MNTIRQSFIIELAYNQNHIINRMENTSVNVKFTGINIVSKEFREPSNQQVPQQFLFDIRLETKVNAQLRLVMPFVYVKIKAENVPDYFAQFTIACLFEINDFENVITLNESNLYVVPEALDLTLRGTALSTSRGIIFSEVRGTYLHNAIMPLVLMHGFVPQATSGQ